MVGGSRVGLADVQLEAVAVERQRRVDEVDGLALPVEHLAGDARDRGVGVQRVDRGAEPAGIGAGVVVEEREVLAGGGARAVVAAAGEPGVLVERDHVAEGAARRIRSALPSPDVVDDDDLEVLGGPVELAKTVDALDRVVGASVVHDDDRHGGGLALAGAGGLQAAAPARQAGARGNTALQAGRLPSARGCSGWWWSLGSCSRAI